ncbi:hypothetical protein ACVWW4_006632 [Bradyrhizobium sp. LB7.1]
MYVPAVPFGGIPLGHTNWDVEAMACGPFASTRLRAQGARAQAMEKSKESLRAEGTTNYLRLTDAAIRAATLPPGKSQHYLHDTEQPGLAMRMRATGGRTWVFMFTKPGTKGTQRKTLGAWPKFNEKAARRAATVVAGEVVIGIDPNEVKREAKRQALAERQCTTLATLIVEDGPYEMSLTGRQVVNWKPAMSALRRGLKDHFDLAIAELTRRQIMAAVDRIGKTGKRGAAKDLRKHTHTFLEWCVGEGLRRAQRARRLSRAQGDARAAGRAPNEGPGADRRGDHQSLARIRQAWDVWALDTNVPTWWPAPQRASHDRVAKSRHG